MIKNNLLVFAASTLALVGFNAHAACSNDGSPATIRAQAIAEAAAFSSSARLAYADYFQANGTAPGSNAIAGYQNPTDVASVSCWTRSVTINTDGVRVQVAATPGYPEGAIELRAQLSNFSVSSWLCSSPDIVEITGLAGCSYTGAVPRKGLTWGKAEADVLSRVVVSSCHGQPSANTADGSCNPYKGDEVCTSALPVLCVAPSFLPKGNIPLQMAATIATKGTSLTSLERGNEICQTAFGKQWRMGSFHDAGGWASKGLGNVDGRVRHWVYINDQKANCWN